MATATKTLNFKINLAPLRWALRQIDHTLTTWFNKPWNVENKYDRQRLRELAQNAVVLDALADDDA
jgi:hypothetical protein